MKRTIMTFNIRYASANDGINSWNNRKEMVTDIINNYSPSILGLQEVEKKQLDFLVSKLPQYKWVGVGRDDGVDKGEFNPIFYKPDSFILTDYNNFSLSESPELFGNKAWDAICNRIVTWAKFKEKSTGKFFYIYNTHFDVNGRKARIKSAELLLSKIRENNSSAPIIVTGDFNCNRSSLPYQILTGETEKYIPESIDLEDAMSVSQKGHIGPSKSFHSFTGKGTEKIDYIFVKDLAVKRHYILNDNNSGKYPSDHFPVLIEFSF